MGEFADVHDQAGSTALGPRLETDSNGDIYASYGGFRSEPRTSFRLAPDGSVSQTFSHPDLLFPDGIDATASGDVFIVNGALVGVGNRLFRFTSGGAYIADYAIPQAMNSSDIAIDELRGELYIADEPGNAILKYDISSGVPIFTNSFPVPGRANDVFVEPTSGRIFGTFYTPETDSAGGFLKYTGFELVGNAVTLFEENAVPRQQTVVGIVAVVIPEPSSGALTIVASFALLLRRRA